MSLVLSSHRGSREERQVLTKSSHLAMPGVLLLSAGLFALFMPPAQRACFTCSHAQQG